MFFSFFIQVAFILLGAYLIRNTNYLRDHGIETEGRVIVPGGQRSMPVIEYYANGELLQVRYRFTSIRSSVRRPVNSRVQIKYNPDKPASLWIVDDKAPYFMGGMLILLGLMVLSMKILGMLL